MKINVFPKKRLMGGTKWYFNITADNGEIIAQSEGYSRAIDARHTAELIQQDAAEAEIVVGPPTVSG